MYKDTYTEEQLGEVIIGLTRQLIGGIWSYTKRERIAAINNFLVNASNYYNMPIPEFEFVEGNEGLRGYSFTGGGIAHKTPYGSVKITMYRKFSLTTLLHEFRHAMQLNGLVEDSNEEGFDVEEDAREWSCSLYYNADPTRYMRAVNAGKLRFA